jgi:hypothetical protein
MPRVGTKHHGHAPIRDEVQLITGGCHRMRNRQYLDYPCANGETFQNLGRNNPTLPSAAFIRRQALLDVFNGTTGNGDWSLKVADLALGGTMTLESWSITLKGESAVLEPATWAAGVAVTLAGLWQWRRHNRR